MQGLASSNWLPGFSAWPPHRVTSIDLLEISRMVIFRFSVSVPSLRVIVPCGSTFSTTPMMSRVVVAGMLSMSSIFLNCAFMTHFQGRQDKALILRLQTCFQAFLGIQVYTFQWFLPRRPLPQPRAEIDSSLLEPLLTVEINTGASTARESLQKISHRSSEEKAYVIDDLRNDSRVLFVRAELNDGLLFKGDLMIMPGLIKCLHAKAILIYQVGLTLTCLHSSTSFLK